MSSGPKGSEESSVWRVASADTARHYLSFLEETRNFVFNAVLT